MSTTRAARLARADQTTVRRANLAVVAQHVARHGPRSRAAIAAETGLTRGTVSSLVAELIDLHVLRDTGEDARPGRVGRPAQTLELEGTLVGVGLEANVDYLAVRVEDLAGGVRFERRLHGDNRGASYEPLLDRLAELATEALAAPGAAGCVPLGVGVAIAGLVELSSGTVLRAPNLGWTNAPVAADLAARLGPLPVRVENEANLGALAEHWDGAARGLHSFLYLFGEIGVGAGLVVDGELFRGANGFAGELGHVVVDADGAACACGSRGCLETVVGLEALARRAGIGASFTARTRSIADELARRASAGDGPTLRTLGDAGRQLGLALASAANLFDVQAIVLGGGFGVLAPWLSADVRDAVRARVLGSPWSHCDVLTSSFGETAPVRGAAAVQLRAVLAAPWTVETLRATASDREGVMPAANRPR